MDSACSRPARLEPRCQALPAADLAGAGTGEAAELVSVYGTFLKAPAPGEHHLAGAEAGQAAGTPGGDATSEASDEQTWRRCPVGRVTLHQAFHGSIPETLINEPQ
ncbi:hypothetical protein P7K49_015215 [Saguinus oedipus]|uniref:Uncharacterized protein n=1 Tax=Saguinus oedipus TaxID=9490 RepID=A0ABQ9V8M0_SAGOE|nr:hypothetical protein P7K49_015215 [Saguinus oedipus]